MAKSSLELPKCIVIEKGTPCGACETVCPSEPVKALIVSGLVVHEDVDGFPF